MSDPIDYNSKLFEYTIPQLNDLLHKSNDKQQQNLIKNMISYKKYLINMNNNKINTKNDTNNESIIDTSVEESLDNLIDILNESNNEYNAPYFTVPYDPKFKKEIEADELNNKLMERMNAEFELDSIFENNNKILSKNSKTKQIKQPVPSIDQVGKRVKF